MKKKDIWFLSKNGRTKLYAIMYLPKRKKPKAILQITHGMAEHIRRYDDFAKHLAGEGYIVVGHDHLGHGNSINTWGDYGYFSKTPLKTLIQDMHQLRVNTAKRYPDLPYFMMGHSMGSYLLRTYLTHFGEGLAGAIIMGTGYASPSLAGFGTALTKGLAFFYGWHHRSLIVQGMTYNKSYRPYDVTMRDLKKSWLTKDTKIASNYVDDPRCGFLFTLNGHRGLFEAVRFACLPENINQLPKILPTLLISGEDDPVGDMGAGVRKVYHLMKEKGMIHVEMKLYPGDRHEILNETDKEIVTQDIINWLDGTLMTEKKRLKRAEKG